jgi:hypothetical protein
MYGNMQQGTHWFRKTAEIGIVFLGIVFVTKPFRS